jgi:pyruvate/2-oxoglutarate dehydrogenase complex dihydrolipoamide dehydrogenase (E3) component
MVSQLRCPADIDRSPVMKISNPFSSTDDAYDLVIVGMGSAGTIAAEFASEQLGLRVAAIERARVGGDCLWTGCVPSKALIASARVAHTVRHADQYAVKAARPEIDLSDVWLRLKSIQAEIAATDDDPERFRSIGIDLIEGEATISGAREVTVGDRVLKTRYTLVCTGSRPFIPPIDGIAEIDFLTTENLFEISRPPDSLIIVGGGPIAAEIAQSLNRLGVDVTVLEMEPRLLPRDYWPHGERLLRILREEGVDIRLGTTARKVRKGGDGVNVWIDDGKVTAQGLLVATGRTPNAHGLGLDGLGIEITRKGITVDKHNRTTVASIYAVGDVAGRALFTHAAAYDAVLAVRDMFLPGHGVPPPLIPWCTFTDPEVAHAGLTEAEAIERHGRRKVQVHSRNLEHSDRARADGVTDGEIVIITAGDRIVGGHAICPHAGELIHELVLAIRFRMKLSDLAEMIHIYPTLASTIGQIAGDNAYRTARRYKSLAKAGRLLG